MTNPAKALGIQPRKSLGQNFLTDDGMARRIVAAADIQPDDLVIEVGPGLGALTTLLARGAREVIAIELDQTLIPPLEQILVQADIRNVRIVHGDALTVDYHALCAGRPVRIVANLPYYITSHFIRTVMESGIEWRSQVLTVQLEVGQRAIARPPEMSLLAVSLQFYGTPELLFQIPPSAFYPQPGIDSATLRIVPNPLSKEVDPVQFFRWVRAGFSQPRKQIRNTIASQLGISKGVTEDILLKSGITPTRRAETLTLHEWLQLTKTGVFYVS